MKRAHGSPDHRYPGRGPAKGCKPLQHVRGQLLSNLTKEHLEVSYVATCHGYICTPYTHTCNVCACTLTRWSHSPQPTRRHTEAGNMWGLLCPRCPGKFLEDLLDPFAPSLLSHCPFQLPLHPAHCLLAFSSECPGDCKGAEGGTQQFDMPLATQQYLQVGLPYCPAPEDSHLHPNTGTPAAAPTSYLPLRGA